MSPTEAQRKARDKWLMEKVDSINFRVPKGSKEHIKEHAALQGESTNAFIWRAVIETMMRDKENKE